MSPSPAGSAPDLPTSVGRPALRAPAAAGVGHLDDLASLGEDDLLRMHGVGPRAVSLLRQALTGAGLSLRADR